MKDFNARLGQRKTKSKCSLSTSEFEQNQSI